AKYKRKGSHQQLSTRSDRNCAC
ncbi:conserved hypothetical protein, partial [Trichinella spiralis]